MTRSGVTSPTSRPDSLPRRRGRFSHRRRTRQHGLRSRQRVLRERSRVCLRHRRRAARGIPRDRERRSDPAGRRCGAGEYVRRAHAAESATYREWAEVRVEALNHALRGIPEEGPLSRLLRELACAAHGRCGARRHRRSDAAGEGRRALDRSRQREARARVARVADGEAAAGQNPDSGRRDASHDDGRASAAGRGSNREVCRTRRT